MAYPYMVYFTVVSLLGCASYGRKDDMVIKAREEIRRLNKSDLEMKVRLEELSNRFMLLKERVNENRRSIKMVGRDAVSLPPPRRLKVVKVSDAEEAGEGKVNFEGADVPEELYHEAEELFWDERYEEAAEGFRRFVQLYPEHDLSDNALYWMGEASYSRHDYEAAIQDFSRVIEEYPGGNKVPDAFLKIGFAYNEMGNEGKAIEQLGLFLERYPKTPLAEKAKAKLKEINTDKEGRI